jgi:hypothetical protein
MVLEKGGAAKKKIPKYRMGANSEDWKFKIL